MYKLEFILKQHTPIIHFQHHQEGATLRASEVKPKLDKYLIYFSFENDYDAMKEYFVGYSEKQDRNFRDLYDKGFCALDYKVSINAETSSIIMSDIREGFPCYFGNLGKENKLNPKLFSFTNNNIIISFLSNHEFLINELRRELPNFFARNNFGTRQSKGFGSFFINESDDKFEEPILLTYYTINEHDPESIFSSIDMVHKTIRSGINDIGLNDRHLFYMKPLIWQYFKLKSITWDKKAIKKNFYPLIVDNQKEVHDLDIEDDNKTKWPIWFDNEDYKLVKDLLGLSLLESWARPYNVTVTKKSNENLERLKSPILYKPILIGNEMRIYIDSDSIPEEFFNAEFTISNDSKNFKIKTPQVEDFNVEDFLKWAFLRANILNYIGESFQNTPKSKRIQSIYNQLRQNYLV